VTRWLLPLLALLVAPAGAQESAPTFRTKTDLVRVDVLVTDRGRPIRGLVPEDFELRDNGVPQRIDRILSGESPIDAWLVLDESGSVRNVVDDLVRAAGAFARALGGNDRSGLIAFRHAVTIRSALTAERSRLPQQLQLAPPAGYTSMRDAVFLALALRQESTERSLILVFSDGEDTISWVTDQQLTRAAADSDAVIYAVAGAERDARHSGGDSLPVSWRSRKNLLESLTAQTGGRLLRTDGRSDSTDAFTRIVQEMKARYVLTYYPSGVQREGWHPLEVRIKGRRAHVRARRGYFGS
jgi:VWFA-related protein